MDRFSFWNIGPPNSSYSFPLGFFLYFTCQQRFFSALIGSFQVNFFMRARGKYLFCIPPSIIIFFLCLFYDFSLGYSHFEMPWPSSLCSLLCALIKTKAHFFCGKAIEIRGKFICMHANDFFAFFLLGGFLSFWIIKRKLEGEKFAPPRNKAVVFF